MSYTNSLQQDNMYVFKVDNQNTADVLNHFFSMFPSYSFVTNIRGDQIANFRKKALKFI